MTTIGVYAGSFDPITYGHLDIIRKATLTFDQVVVAVGENPAKTGVFSFDERQDLIRTAVSGMGNTRVVSFQGLLVNYCRSLAQDGRKVAIVRGLRAVSDFEVELVQAHLNEYLGQGIPTVFFPSDPSHSFISSSVARSLSKFGGEARIGLERCVPSFIADALQERLGLRP